MAFPTTSILDTFNRANGDPGANWNGPSFGDANKLTIVSNTIESAAAAFGAECWIGSTFGPGIEVFADLASTIAGGASVRLIVLDSPTSSTCNGYYLVVDSAGNFNLAKSVSGSGTVIQTATQAVAAGDSFGLQWIGTTIAGWYKASGGSWTQIVSIVDSSVANGSGFSVGIEQSTNSGGALDNFGGGTVAAGGLTYDQNKIHTRLQAVARSALV
jgi:hypothetical protein